MPLVEVVGDLEGATLALRDELRKLRTFLVDSEERYQHALNRLSEADPVTQMVQLLRELNANVLGLRKDMYEARVGSDHAAVAS